MPFPEDAHFRPFYEIGKVFGIWVKPFQLLDKFSQPLGNKTLQQLPDLYRLFLYRCVQSWRSGRRGSRGGEVWEM